VLVVVAAASAYLVRKPADNPVPPKPAEAAKPTPAAEVTQPAHDKPQLVVAAKPVDVPAATLDVAKRAEETKKLAEERGQFLETIGTLTSAHYFQTYLNIGFIADGKAKGTYTDKDARKVLDSVLSVLTSADRRLEALDKVELGKDDREKLEQLRAVSALLRQQGKELNNYWDTGKEDQAAKYETLRKNAWVTISSLMGFGQ